MTILIVTHSKDNDAPVSVARALESRGERVYRFDTDLFPTTVQLSLDERGRGGCPGPRESCPWRT
ncbi:MvdC/MvdD family ATP grasp protein [Cystobacter fuscus]